MVNRVLDMDEKFPENVFFRDDTCAPRTRFMSNEFGYECCFGTAYHYVKGIKSWVPLWDFHYWLISEGQVMDSYYAIQTNIKNFKQEHPNRFVELNDYRYKLLDIDDMKKRFDFGDWKVNTRISFMKELNKCFSPKNYDLIYVEGIGTHPLTQGLYDIEDAWLDWESWDDTLEEYKNDLLERRDSVVIFGVKKFEEFSY